MYICTYVCTYVHNMYIWFEYLGLPVTSTEKIKAMANFHDLCVLRNFESSEQYLSVKCPISEPPTVWFIQPCALCFGCVHIHYLGKWEEVGPWILEFFGPQMALDYWLDDFSQGLKHSRFSGPNPFPLPLIMDMHASKTLRTGLYKS